MFDVHRVAEVLSEILSDKYGVKITITVIPKEGCANDRGEAISCGQ